MTQVRRLVVLIGVLSFSGIQVVLPQATYHRVPLVRLLLFPDDIGIENTIIDVMGYLARHGDLWLYLTRDHEQVWDYASAILIADAKA